MSGRRKGIAGLVATALYLAGPVASAPGMPGDDAPATLRSMDISLTPAAVDITADVTSDTHAETLEELVDERFPDHTKTMSWYFKASADADWQLLTFAAIDLLAETSVVRMHVEPGMLDVEGLRPPAGLFNVRLARVEATAGEGFESRVAVAVTDPAAGRQVDACRTMFQSLRGEPIRFYIGTEDLRPSSLPLLDRYVEFATDCPESRLAVVGHTDASGDESFNQYLAKQRARIVVNYLARAGIASERLRALGKGSSEPVADNRTAWGRSQNRRIEVLLEP